MSYVACGILMLWAGLTTFAYIVTRQHPDPRETFGETMSEFWMRQHGYGRVR